MRSLFFFWLALALPFPSTGQGQPVAPTSGVTASGSPASGPPASEAPNIEPVWEAGQIAELRRIVDARQYEGLGDCPIPAFDQAGTDKDTTMRSRLATAAARVLMLAYVDGCAPAHQRVGWHIRNEDRNIDMTALLAKALRQDSLKAYIEALRPTSPHYEALRKAYATEQDDEKRAILALNMERWRWMPRAMGERYLLVNTASFELALWEKGRKTKSWPVIVGKTRTPSPVFEAEVSGVILNPWWEIPSSIAAEGISAIVRNNPAAARRKGYVYQNGRYRQRPGPGNALGQMKLVMPNPYSVFLHDTPNKKRFEEPVRAFSHGCIRVGGAIDFAKTLLAGAVPPEKVDAILTERKTTRMDMTAAIPLYITYFTASMTAGGSVTYYPDIYRRDHLSLAAATQADSAALLTETKCGA